MRYNNSEGASFLSTKDIENTRFPGFGEPGYLCPFCRFSPPVLSCTLKFSKAGADTRGDTEGLVHACSGGILRAGIQVSIDICCGREVAVAQPFLDFLHGYSVLQQQTGTSMPLWHNKYVQFSGASQRFTAPANR